LVFGKFLSSLDFLVLFDQAKRTRIYLYLSPLRTYHFLPAKPGKNNIPSAMVPDRVLISPDFLRTFGLPRFTGVNQKVRT
jgi:hypothetical protein